MTTSVGYGPRQVALDVEAGLGTPRFWACAISPSTADTPLDASRAHAIEECRAMWDSGARYVALVMDGGARTTGTRAMGVADAMTCCHAIRHLYNWVGPLELPSSSIVFAYLALSPGHDLGLAYWQGWAGYVHSFGFAGHHPLYPALQCNPEGAEVTCRTVNRAGAPDCWAVWATAPAVAETSDGFAGERWAPARCESPFPATVLWQVAPGVHVAAPDRPVLETMFVLLDRP